MGLIQRKRVLIAKKLRDLFPGGCHRILLVEPPNVAEEDHDIKVALDNRYPIYPPNGLAILAADLLKNGYETEILDLNFMMQKNLKTNDGFRYSDWQNWLTERIYSFKPEAIGLTCMFAVSHRQMEKTAEYIARNFPNIVIFAGGVNTTNAVEVILERCLEIDFICLNEGNETFSKIINFCNDKTEVDDIFQIASLVDGQPVILSERISVTQASLDILPDYGDLPIDKYSSFGRIGTFFWLLKPGTRSATCLSNRGCRGNCRYCSVRSFNGRGVFSRSVSAVIDELQMLRDKYGIGHIMWLDDDLLYDSRRAIELFSAMVQKGLKISWDASNGIIASSLNDEIIAAAEESGCIALSFGIESGNDEVLSYIRKPSSKRHYLNVAEIMHRHPKIFTKGLLMFGFLADPKNGFSGENVDMVWDTIDLAQEMNLDWYTIQPLNFIPGTEMTNQALNERLINVHQLIDGSEKPHTGSTGIQIKIGPSEKFQMKEFTNILSGPGNHIPTREEIPDIWFVIDYMLNYPRVVKETRPIKIGMLHRLFENMCDWTHKDHALGNLYFSKLELMLGNLEQARYRINIAQEMLASSEYWKKRFSVLGIENFMYELKKKID